MCLSLGAPQFQSVIGWVLWIADSERNFLARNLLEGALRISLSVGAKEAGLSREGSTKLGQVQQRVLGLGWDLIPPHHPFAD